MIIKQARGPPFILYLCLLIRVFEALCYLVQFAIGLSFNGGISFLVFLLAVVRDMSQKKR